MASAPSGAEASGPSDAGSTTGVGGQPGPGANKRVNLAQATLAERMAQAERSRQQFPNRVPVVLQRSPKCRLTGGKDEEYLVVPDDFTVGRLVAALRQRIALQPTDGLYLYVKGALPNTSATLSAVYQQYKSEDNLLYIVYDTESTYGGV